MRRNENEKGKKYARNANCALCGIYCVYCEYIVHSPKWATFTTRYLQAHICSISLPHTLNILVRLHFTNERNVLTKLLLCEWQNIVQDILIQWFPFSSVLYTWKHERGELITGNRRVSSNEGNNERAHLLREPTLSLFSSHLYFICQSCHKAFSLFSLTFRLPPSAHMSPTCEAGIQTELNVMPS